VRGGWQAVALDSKAKRVRIVDAGGASSDEAYDALVWASGTSPIAVEGVPDDDAGLGPSTSGRRVAVVGAGFHALEAIARAESLAPKDVLWIVPGEELAPELDVEIAHVLERNLAARGVLVARCGSRVRAERHPSSDSWRVHDERGGEWSADVAVAAMGITPDV